MTSVCVILTNFGQVGWVLLSQDLPLVLALAKGKILTPL